MGFGSLYFKDKKNRQWMPEAGGGEGTGNMCFTGTEFPLTRVLEMDGGYHCTTLRLHTAELDT